MDLYFILPVVLLIIIGSSIISWLFMGNRRLKKNNHLLKKVFNQVAPICVTDKKHEIISANDTYWSLFGEQKNKNQPIKCFEHRPGESCHTENCPLTQILKGQEKFTCEPQKELNGEIHYFIVTARPFYGQNNDVLGVIESFQDVTEKKKLEEEKTKLISELQGSLEKVKLLSGFIPICASCKKVRDDKGFWSQVEAYITKHSEAKFSHGICPECVQTLYPEFAKNHEISKQ